MPLLLPRRQTAPPGPDRLSPRPAAALRRDGAAWWRPVVVIVILILTASIPAATPAAAAVRFGFSRSMFRGVNENDARASLKAYAATIAHEQQIMTHPDAVIFGGTRDGAEALRQENIDLISGTAEEILGIDDALLTGPYLLSNQGEAPGTRYVLLVRQESDATQLSGLKGRRLLVLNSIQGSLAGCWLEVLLAGNGLPPPGEFFGAIQAVAKPTLAALPVFFGQTDACVVTSDNLAVIGEMNPQVARQLRVLATSDLLIPAVTCFRRGFDATQKRRVIDSMTSVNSTPAGRQLLTIFQSGRIGVHDDAALDSTRRLLSTRARLQAGQAPTAEPAGPPPLPRHPGLRPFQAIPAADRVTQRPPP